MFTGKEEAVMTTLLTLGQRIRQAREQAHIRQVELARRIGISANALNSIEHGETDPRVSRVVAIARELQVSTNWLLGLDNDTPQPKRLRTRKAAAVG